MVNLKNQKAVVLVRCSTSKQEKMYSHAAQTKACKNFCKDNGIEILKIFKETESGRKGFSNRPVLLSAIAHAQKHNAVLVVAKLCRLSRKVSEVAKIMEEAKQPLLVCNLGRQVDALVINLLASVNAFEAEMISVRTKEGLAVAKSKGVKLGNPKIHIAQANSRKVRTKAADDFALKMKPTFLGLIKSSCKNNAELAEELNRMNIKTVRGKDWTTGGVIRLLKRLENLGEVENAYRAYDRWEIPKEIIR
jgi:DNA invertase Pin-like site-specific DNA recombinase